MTQRRKVLFLSARLPYPLDSGGKIRAYHVLRSLAGCFRVTMLAFGGEGSVPGYVEALEKLGVDVVIVRHPKIDRPSGVANAISNIGSSLPLTIAKYKSSAMKKAVERLIDERFDIIHCEQLHMAEYAADCCTGVLKVMDAHNVESQIAERYARKEGNFFKKAFLFRNCRKMLRYEKRAAASFDLILTVSSNDQETLVKYGGGNRVKLVENGVDTDYFRPLPESRANHLVFVGSMDWLPNVDGMLYFLNDIYPLIKAAVPHVKLSIVGKNPPASLARAATTTSSVYVTGTVDDVRPYVADTSVFVVPLRFGGGTRLKILEAFAMGRAVVSTSLGAEGIEGLNGQHFLIADEPKQFADAVVRLLSDEGLRASLTSRARQLAEGVYSWDVVGSKLLSYYNGLLAQEGI